MTPKRKAKASPKKKATSPLPDDSPISGSRRYEYKGVGIVRVLQGEKQKTGVRTPRRYQVVNRKRPAASEQSRRTRRRLDAIVAGYTEHDPAENVFERDEIERDGDPDLDSE